ncbi:MAG: TRAP transporter substrate-binding protein [Desulfobacterales bacterium]|nr:TRAP transporter substrate-binding protein [Desulfobacterales bacterium]
MKFLKHCTMFGILLSFGLAAGTAVGAEKVTLRALGNFTKQIQSTAVEQPFFKKLGEESGGRLNVQFRTMDELGQKGFQGMRQLKGGVFDIMAIQLGYVSGDDPFFQGVDLVGVSPDIATTRKVAEAYREEFDSRLQKKFGGKLLAIWPYGDQIFWFKDKVNGLDDFKGKKIRIFSRPMAEFVKKFGATGVSLAFPEVYTSLHTGVIDGAVSGSLAGNTASWYEAANHLYMMPMGYSLQLHVVNLDFWNKLTPDVKDYLTKKFKELEDELWKLGASATQDGVNCNTGQGVCTYGKKGKMSVVHANAKDKERMKKAVEEVVLPDWAASANKIDPKAIEIWNRTVGKVVGMTIK